MTNRAGTANSHCLRKHAADGAYECAAGDKSDGPVVEPIAGEVHDQPQVLGSDSPSHTGPILCGTEELRNKSRGLERNDRSPRLQGVSSAESGCPGPLEIESSQMSRDIHNFADEKQSWYRAALHGFRGQFICIDAPRGDLRLLVAFRPSGQDFPMMNPVFQILQCSSVPALGRMQFDPAVCEAIRDHRA